MQGAQLQGGLMMHDNFGRHRRAMTWHRSLQCAFAGRPAEVPLPRDSVTSGEKRLLRVQVVR